MTNKTLKLPYPPLFTPFVLFLLLFLSGCGSTPTLSESQLILGNQKILIGDLYCPANGDVVAAGYDGRNGVLLLSEDQGANWRRAGLDPTPADVFLSLIRSRTKGGKSILYVSGYRHSMFPMSNEPPHWWMSTETGQIWMHAEPPLPLGKPRGSIYLNRQPEAVVASPGILVATSTESDGVYLLRSEDDGEHWNKQPLKMPRDFASPIVSDGNGNLAFFGESLDTSPISFNQKLAIYWSFDAGLTWVEGDNTLFISNMGVHRSSNGTIVAFNIDDRKYGGTYVIYSNNNGKSWQRSKGLDTFGRIVGISEDSRGRTVAFTDFGIVLLSDDGGVNWRNVGQHADPYKARNYWFGSFPLKIMHSDDGVTVAIVGNKIIRSIDRGEHWKSVDSKLSDKDFRFSALCSNGQGLIIAAGDGMMTRSLDWGTTWQPAGRYIYP